MGLFQPGWMSRDEQKAMRALEKVTDDDTLFRIASESPHLSVQIKAAQKIRNTDRRLDAALTKRLLNYEVRMAALEGASEEGRSSEKNEGRRLSCGGGGSDCRRKPG